MTRDLTAVRQELNNLDSSVVVQELEFSFIWSFVKLVYPIHRRKVFLAKMFINKSINLFRLFNFTILLTKSSFQLTTSLSNILHITVLSV